MLVLDLARCLLFLSLQSQTVQIFRVRSGFIDIQSAVLGDNIYLTAAVAFYFYSHHTNNKIAKELFGFSMS